MSGGEGKRERDECGGGGGSDAEENMEFIYLFIIFLAHMHRRPFLPRRCWSEAGPSGAGESL